MGNKKIAMISHHTCPLASRENQETGGMNVYILELAKALAAKGINIDIFTRCQDEKAQKIVQVTANLRVIHIIAGPQKVLPKKQLNKYLNEFTDNLIKFTEKRIPYGILHCHYYLSGLIGLKLKEKLKINMPLIMTFHTLALLKNLVAKSVAEKENLQRIKSEFLLINKCNKIIALSNNDLQYLTNLYDCPIEKIAVINPGVNIQSFYPLAKKEAKKILNINTDDKIILYVGRIEPLKGIDSIIYALKIFNHQYPKMKLTLMIVGAINENDPIQKSPELVRLQNLCKTLKICSSVKFVFQQQHEKLIYYYNAADVVVMPSHYEAFGMVALEAMACGVPVITSVTSGIASIYDKDFSDLLISANDPLALANQIEKIIMDENLSQQFKTKMLEKIQDFSWSKTSEKILTVYKSTTGI